MIRVCLVCKTTYGTVPCLPEQGGKTTHGYCLACLPRVQAAIDAEIAALKISDVRQSAPAFSQAATPQAGAAHAASGAVNDNASEVLAADIGKHVPLGGDSCVPVFPNTGGLGDPKHIGHAQAVRGAFFPQ